MNRLFSKKAWPTEWDKIVVKCKTSLIALVIACTKLQSRTNRMHKGKNDVHKTTSMHVGCVHDRDLVFEVQTLARCRGLYYDY